MEDYMYRAYRIWVLDQIIGSIEEKIEDEIEEKFPLFSEKVNLTDFEEKLREIPEPLYQEFFKLYNPYVKEFIDPDPSNNSLSYLIAQTKKSWGIYSHMTVNNASLVERKIIREPSGREYRVCIYREKDSDKRIIVAVDENFFDYVRICERLDLVGCKDEYPSDVELIWNPLEEVYRLHAARRIWVEKARKVYWVNKDDDKICYCEE